MNQAAYLQQSPSVAISVLQLIFCHRRDLTVWRELSDTCGSVRKSSVVRWLLPGSITIRQGVYRQVYTYTYIPARFQQYFCIHIYYISQCLEIPSPFREPNRTCYGSFSRYPCSQRPHEQRRLVGRSDLFEGYMRQIPNLAN